ncbi:MAG: IS630 family transposase [Candidatus Microsaccharimonas sossegonensis]|uniref:IS630 family transposase n=1 Tax=Candidatus Microsaccharimonas sossegonensis TaxID=2506948 RepID=A0A4Q0AGG4_9BACT|nr:MAG: IS630 family transposase [Candidatus Microsaccharimonas sossegonensis]
MAAAALVITLSEADRRELERLQRASAGPAGLARRARVVLLIAGGLGGVQVAERTGYTPVQVSRIRHRFAAAGVGALRDRPRSGRPRVYGERMRAKIVARTLKPAPAGQTHWSTRDLAKEVGVSHETVRRIWRDHALAPHRSETFKFTSDPRAAEKIEDIVGLYLAPPTSAVVLCMDEKTQIQALERTQPILPLRTGIPARQTHDYRRNGLTDLYAALEVRSGKVTGELATSHTGADFLHFLETLSRRYRRRELHIVLDNSSTHSVPAVQRFLAAHPDIHFHFTPTGASWMNMVEAWFGILTRKSIRRGSFPSVGALMRHIKAYIARWNEHPTPFVWTKDPSQIIRKAVRRGVNKTSQTAH